MAKVFCLAAALLAAVCAADASPLPNIVFILADDLGFNELGYQNTTRGLITPNIDALASEAVRLKQYYVQPICSPTRSSLMTGRYTIRLGTQSNVIFWDTPWGVPIEEKFLPALLKESNYSTAMFGKWHLGMFKKEYTPTYRGFDHHHGYYQGCESHYTHVAACCTAGSPDHDQEYVCGQKGGAKDYRGYDWFVNGTADFSVNKTNSADLIRDAAVDFIHAQSASTPFFLYLPFQNIHGPYTCDPAFFSLYNDSSKFTLGEQTMFGYISELDYAIGFVVQALKDTNAYDNTIIIFSSDNGAPKAGDDVDHPTGQSPGWIARNHPFRGYKTLIWEGGMRVAGFIHSPLLPESVKNTDNNNLFHVTDWYPTIAKLAGLSTSGSGPRPLDGFDIWPAISTGEASPRKTMLYNINPLCSSGQAGAPKAGIRIGDYKLLSWCYNISGVGGATSTGPVAAPPGTKNVDPELTKGPVLYDLAKDPGERNNIAQDNAPLVAELLVALKKYAEQSVLPQQWTPPYQGDDYFCKDCPLHPGSKSPNDAWEPWL